MQRPTKRNGILILSALLVKVILMTVTPLSLDLAFLISQVSGQSKWAMTPYGAFMRLILEVWRIIPVDHPVLSSSWTVDFFHASTGLWLLVFMMKLPLLTLEVLVGLLLRIIVLQNGLGSKQATFAFFLWFLNPYATLMNEMWAAVDLLPTFLVLLTFAGLQAKNRALSGVAAFGAATASKLFPIMLLPIFISIERRSKFSLLFLLSGLVGAAIYFGWVSYAGYDPWLQLNQYDPFTQYFDEYLIATAGGQKIGLATFALISTYALLERKWPRQRTAVLDALLMVLLVFFAFGNWFPQFLVWIIPFLILDAVVGKRGVSYMTLLLTAGLFMDVVAFYTYFTANGNAFFFVPADNLVLKQAVAGYESFAREDLVVLLGGPLARALFTSTCILYVIKLIEQRTRVVSTLVNILSRAGFRRS